MGRGRVATNDRLVTRRNLDSRAPAIAPLKRGAATALSPPACFISAMALSVILGSGGAIADPGGCTSTVPGVDLTCSGTVNTNTTFTATSDFTVNIQGNPNAANITSSTSSVPALQINTGDYAGTVSMGDGATIATTEGAGSRHGIVVTSTASSDKTYTIDLDGQILSVNQTADKSGDALRLDGTSHSDFNIEIDENGKLGGGTGDDGIIVVGAGSLLLKNYGLVSGGSGDPVLGGDGINVGNGTRTAEGGITIENYGTITGTGNPNITFGQGVNAFGLGDVTVVNGEDASITGTTQGVRVEAAGAVTITNDGHIQGNSESGVEIADGTTAKVTNKSADTIEGATNGLYIHDVDEANVINDHGHIIGDDGDGVRVENVDGNVSIKNRFDHGHDQSKIEGSDDGVHVTGVDENVSIDNRFGGDIIGHGDDGIHIHDVDGKTSIDNSFFGDIRGHDDGVNVNDAGDDVTITNRFGGSIRGERDDGVNVHDADEDVTVDNRSGGDITGHDNGVAIHDGDDDVVVDNRFGGDITGWNDDGVTIDDVRDDVSVSNGFGGDIRGHDTGVEISHAGGDATVDNSFGGTIRGENDNGIDISHIGDEVEVDNGRGGNVRGDDDGIHIERADGRVAIDNSSGGRISGWHDDGIDISNVDDDVLIDNSSHGSIAGFGDNGIQIDDVDGSVSIDNTRGGRISGHDDGIHISNVDDEVRIDNRFGGTILGWHDDGIDISDVDDDVRISNSFGGNIVGDHNGVQVRDARDDVTVDNRFGGDISGRDSNGIDISDVRDDVTVDNRFGGDISGHDAGVGISDVRGDVTIDNRFGGEISGSDDSGVDVSDVRGDTEIRNDRGTITGDEDGIRIDDVHDDVAIHNWHGTITGDHDGVHVRDAHDDVTISNSFGGTITGENDDGIDIEDVGDDVRIYNLAGDIRGDDHGIKISDVDGEVRVDNSFRGYIRGDDGDGVRVSDVDDDVNIRNSLFGTIVGHDDGVHVRDAGDDVTVNNDIGGKIIGWHDDGVDISDVDDNVRVSNRYYGSISGHDNGVQISDVGGDVTIDNDHGRIRGWHGAAIDATAGGTATVNNDGGSLRGRTNGVALDAETAEINSSGLIEGSGTSDPTIKLTTALGATLNNEAGGVIRGEAGAPTDLIVEAHGGAVTINNAGTMTGQIDLSDAGTTLSPNVFNNSSNHSWTFIGTSQFGNGLNDAFNNTGTVFTTDPNAPSTKDVTVLAGLESFNNGSSTKTGTIDLQDGFTGDVTTLSPTSGGTLNFKGIPGRSFLAVDSFLGTSTNSSSDQLVIQGNVSGSTGIKVNNVNPGFGSYNPGINVVSASGSLSPGNFYLAGGPIDTGMFTYDLYLGGPNQWVLASAPNHVFFELPTLTSAAQSMWHDAAGVWLDRTADLRESLEHPCAYEPVKGSTATCTKPTQGAWIKALGATESRSTDHAFSLFNTTQITNTDYEQHGGGVVAGYDVVRSNGDGPGLWLAGVMGGYLRSAVDFGHSQTSADFEGGSVGGYVTYLQGPWFLDAKILANLGTVDYAGAFAVKDSANVRSIGGVLDTGYRIERANYFIEPGATLAYVNTSIDDLAVYGTTVNFANGNSLRGRVGVRLGTTVLKESARYEPFVGLSGWYEFLGDNTADVTSGGYRLQAIDNLSGALGDVTGGVNIYSLAGDGISGFIKGDFQFGKDDYVSYGGTFGLRVDW